MMPPFIPAPPSARPHAGRVAWVTGSTSGIGQAIARQLASEGAAIAVHGSRPASAQTEALLSALRQQHCVQADYFAADLRDSAAIADCHQQIVQRLGAVDILVNNAGRQHVARLPDFAPEAWNDLLAINLSAPFHTLQACIPAMRARGWGRIVNMASVSALIGVAGKSAYVASKHALLGLTKTVALELADTAITCNAICPGWVLTPLVQTQIAARAQREQLPLDQARQQLLRAKQPSGDFVTEQQVASLVSYLASAQAAQVRGACWNMDGGYVAQ